MKADQPIPAVAYYRMSSDDQTVSIPRQEKEVKEYAEQHNFQIIRVYMDEGLSGSKEEVERPEFNRLLLDASLCDFRAVLCYNASRFARLDSIDGADAKKTLRKRNIFLETVCNGRIDWNTVEGRMHDFMLSEQNHAFSRTLARDSVGGRLRAINDGCWPYGCIPYGYDRLYLYGDQQHRVSRTTPFRKPRNWKLKLVVNDLEAAVVKRIFHLFVEKAWSMRSIANTLKEEGIPAPDNLPKAQRLGWTDVTVGGILRHKSYIGIASIGGGRKTAKTAFVRLPPTEKRGCCPVIIEDEKVFEQAQAMLQRNKERKARQQPSRAGLLSGFLFCGHCGHSLKKEQRGEDGPVKYVCESSARRGKIANCPQWSIPEADVLQQIVNRVVWEVDTELLATLDSKPRVNHDAARTDILTKHVETLRGKFATAQKRYAAIEDDELALGVLTEVRRLKSELADAEKALNLAVAVEAEGGVRNFQEWWDEKKETILVAVVGKYEYDGITRIDLAGSKVQPNPDFVVIDDEVWEVDHNPDLGPEPTNLVAEPISFDRDAFRALLNRLGVEVTVRWVKANKGAGNRRWNVDHARLKIALTWQCDDGSAKQDVQGRNGTCSPVGWPPGSTAGAAKWVRGPRPAATSPANSFN